MKCPHCNKTISGCNIANFVTATINVENYGSGWFTFECPHKICEKKFTIHISRRVVVDKDSLEKANDNRDLSF